MKMEILVAEAARYIGSSTTAISTTFPSAGAITNCSPRGPVRTGSRKNTRSHRASRRSAPSGTHSHGEPRATQAPSSTSAQPGTMKGQPSGATRIIVHRLKPVLGTTLPLRAVLGRAHPSGWENEEPSRFNLQRLPRDQAERLPIPLARRLHHLQRQRRRRGIAVPLPLLLQARQVVAQRLLVEARLRASRLVAVRRPEARRVGREDLVDHEEPPVRARAELELRVGDDDAARARVAPTRLLQREAGLPQLPGHGAP